MKVAPTAKPPVCKIIDYGKYKYEMARKEKEAKKRQKIIEIKEVRLSPNIDDNDLGATFTRSSSASLAIFIASLADMIPSCSPLARRSAQVYPEGQ